MTIEVSQKSQAGRNKCTDQHELLDLNMTGIGWKNHPSYVLNTKHLPLPAMQFHAF